MSIVLEAALSAFFDLLFYKLSSPDLLKIFRQENVDADLKKWAMKLRKIRAVLADAEEKQMTDEFVKSWLVELQDLAYDADDILDEFATEALRRELNAEVPSTSTVIKFINDCVGSDRDFFEQMRSKIEGIDRRLQEIVEEKKDLELRENTGRRTVTKTSRPPSTSLVNESRTYGRDEDKKEIVKLLLESSDAQLSVIPIVGMGGLGKTTLAQLVYKDDEVSRHFELKAWVCVSEDFDNLRLTKKILHSFTFESWDNNSSLNTLQVKLGEKLSRKKFLLILDDVWNEDYELWTQLRKPFDSGAPGSKIVVTTRKFGVTSTMGTTPPYKLEELSHDACLRVFTHHALDATDFSKHPELEEFGQKIVNRCKGVPLAAKVLGGLLRTARNRNEWEHVLNSEILDIPEEKDKIFSVLKLSYNYLPSHLKRCFAYCSLFPKDDEFEEKDLVLLWMAEGLVQETKGKRPMEDLGGDYFHDLLNRSFFQRSSDDESLFVMPDLMHDLAQWAAGDLYCRLEIQLGGSKQPEISTKVRHFSYIELSNDCIQKFDEDVHLRTFLSLPLYNRYGFTEFDVKYCLFPRLRCLRVLSLSGNDIIELPSSIGDLKHLRYLNLSYTKIRILPKSTSSLYNLQTLLLKGCDYLTKLPEKIENLVNLRHLDITNANSIIEMPVGIAKLKSLRTLSNFVVGKDKIVDLMNLESLQGKLCISHLENMLDSNDARKVNLKGKKNLDTLVMKWDDDLQDARIAVDILDMLRPHGTMKTLSIEGYVGANFPTWLGDPSFSNMVDLRIERCGKCMFLPAFGQLPFLKHLVIKRMDGVRSIGPEFYGEDWKQPFRSLVKLCFEDMDEWENWIPCNQDFPCLRELSISNCPKLEGKFPHHLPSLEELFINECKQLIVSIPSHSVLQVLKIVQCREVVHGFVKVKKLIIKNCEKLTSLCEDELMSLVTLEIKIKSCQSLVNIKLKSTLRTLTIKDCSALESLQFVMDEGGASSTSSLLMNEENLSCIDNNNASLIEHLEIFNCPSLKCVSTIVDLAAMLERLLIEGCPNLTSLSSKDALPTTLKVLWLDDCRKLESIVDKLDKDTLLEDLLINRCEKLRCLPRGLHELCHLKKIDIYRCNSLISLGDLLPTNLRSLEIDDCEKLEALPNNIHNLNFLQDLLIRDCPSIVSFPEEGFPTDLRKLRLIGANLCMQVFELGLDRLTSLTSLEISDGIMDSFPEEEDGKTMLMLPTSLTTLSLYNFPNLLFLSWKFFQKLSALEQISIGECPKLASLSEKCYPPSLQRLIIYKCPELESRLESMVDKGLQELCHLEKIHIIKGCAQGAGECLLPMSHTPNSRNEADVLTNTWSNQDGVQDLSFQRLKVSEISELLDLPSHVHCLKIEECDDLELIPQGQVPSSPVIKESKEISETEESEECEEETDADIETTLKAKGIKPEQDESNEEDPSPSLFSEDKSSLPPTQGARESSLSTSQDPVECSLPMSHAPNSRNEADVLTNTWSNQDGVQDLSFESIKVSEISELMDLPSRVNSLKIEECDHLEFIPKGVMSSELSLQDLYIINCCSLKSFPEDRPPTALEILYIRNCKKLNFPLTEKKTHQDALLKYLCIGSSCDSLKFLSLDLFPNLKSLSIWDCANLESLSMPVQKNLTSFEALEIRDCPNLVSFIGGGLCTPNLMSIWLSNCKKLKKLPEMHTLGSLQSVFLNNCPELVSLSEKGLPSRLGLLSITFCNQLKLKDEWGLDGLEYLRRLEIEGGCVDMESFPEKFLSSNLSSLRISGLLNLKNLDKGFQKLTTLQRLEISCCPNLRSLPEDGFPSSLSFLCIKKCSLLTSKFRNKKGKDWSKIDHISCIEIDEEVIS